MLNRTLRHPTDIRVCSPIPHLRSKTLHQIHGQIQRNFRQTVPVLIS